ncbi:MAG: hypothetical protein RUDDFDWM_001528 [Candidatus Fervidibacterota bacterium]
MHQQQWQRRQQVTGLQIGAGELGVGEILIAKAEPDIYLNNPFRLLQLSTNASLSQIQRKIHELELRIQLGIDPPSQNLQFIRQTLSDPLQRLAYEIFWFWGDENSDEGLRAFRDGNVGGAITIWEQMLNDFNAVHNLSVLFHFMALELELRGNLKMATTRYQWQSHWQKAWELWLKSIDGGGIRRYLRNRVRELNDPRVNERTVEEFSKALPLALALINARLALRAAERTDDDSLASFHRKLLLEFTTEAIAIWALKKAAKPLIDELQVLSETTHQDDISHNPLQKAHQLLEQATRPVRILDKLLPDDPDVQALRDKTAMGVRRLVHAAVKPDDFSQLPEIVKLLKVAANLAGTAEAKRSLINEASNLETMLQVIPLLNELTALLKEADSKAQRLLSLSGAITAMDDAERLLNKAEPLLRQLDAVSIEDSELNRLRNQFYDAVAVRVHHLIVEAVKAGNRNLARAKALLERALKIARDPQQWLVLQMEIQSLEMIIARQRESSARKTGWAILVGVGLIIGFIGFISNWWQQTNSTHRGSEATVQDRSSQIVPMVPSSPKTSLQAQSKTKAQWIEYLGLQQHLKEYEEGRLKRDSIREILSDLTYEQSSVRLDKETYGDLDGDGLKEKIVVVGINTGGSGTFVYLLVLKKGRCIAVKSLGDRIVVNSLTVKKREIILDMLTHDFDDPMATPTKKVVARYRLVGENLLSEESLRLAYLEKRIKNLKSEITRIESAMLKLTDSIMRLRSNIETLRKQITAIEQTHPSGFFTDEEFQNYQALVRQHDELVGKHNALVRQGRLLLQQYKQKIAEYNRLVDEYNNLRLKVE